MKKTLQSLVRKGLTYAEALLLLTSLNACNDTEVEITKPPVASATLYPETTQSPETTGFVSQDETTGEEITNEETTITPEQLKNIEKLLDLAYSYDHDLDKGIASIVIQWPIIQDADIPYYAVLVPIGTDIMDLTNLSFEISEEAAKKFKQIFNNDYKNNVLPFGLSKDKINDFGGTVFGPSFDTTITNNPALNKYLSIISDFIPETPFYFEDKSQISDENLESFNNYLIAYNNQYDNGLFSIRILKDEYASGETKYSIELSPRKNKSTTELPQLDLSVPALTVEISEEEYNNYRDFFTLENYVTHSTHKLSSNILQTENIITFYNMSDTLKSQIFNQVYTTIATHNQQKQTHLEQEK